MFIVYLLLFLFVFCLGAFIMAIVDYRFVKKVCEKNYINFDYFYKPLNLKKEAKKIIEKKRKKEIQKKYYKK